MTDEFHNNIPAAPKEREAERESEIAAGVYAGTNLIPKLKKLHPIWFILLSAIAGIVLKMG